MLHNFYPITEISQIGENIFTLTFRSPEMAFEARPGQFINIRVNDSSTPLLRRPFSIYHVDGEEIQILFNTIGEGTKMLSRKNIGEFLDVIGPLGKPFTSKGNFKLAILVAGGMGVASLPVLTTSLTNHGISIETFLGARTSNQLVTKYLKNVHIATDDGSEGYHGTVVEMLVEYFRQNKSIRPIIFACGPPVMLSKVSTLADDFNFPCELSIESVMACGIGICQGCPVERVDSEKKYSLVCKDGPVFNSKTIRIKVDD